MTDGYAPPGWPTEVLPAGEEIPGWRDSAVDWLLSYAPTGWRADPVLMRHPVVLARFCVERTRADIQAARVAWSRTGQLATGIDGDTGEVEQALKAMLTREGPRLAQRLAQMQMVAAALAGNRWTPRL